MFEHNDTDHDGKLTRNEFRKFMHNPKGNQRRKSQGEVNPSNLKRNKSQKRENKSKMRE